MLISQAQTLCTQAIQNEDNAELTDIMSKFFTSRGYVPAFSTIDEIVIDFLCDGGLCLDDLVHRNQMPRMQARLLLADLRHFKQFTQYEFEPK